MQGSGWMVAVCRAVVGWLLYAGQWLDGCYRQAMVGWLMFLAAALEKCSHVVSEYLGIITTSEKSDQLN